MRGFSVPPDRCNPRSGWKPLVNVIIPSVRIAGAGSGTGQLTVDLTRRQSWRTTPGQDDRVPGCTEGIEQVELTEPWSAVEDAGGTPRADVDRAGQGAGVQPPRQGRHVRRRQHRRRRRRRRYDGLVLPGGVANPDYLRMRRRAVEFARASSTQASRCGDLPRAVDAGRGRVVAGAGPRRGRACKTDLRNAGATWVDEEVVVDTTGSSR